MKVKDLIYELLDYDMDKEVFIERECEDPDLTITGAELVYETKHGSIIICDNYNN